ncbi:MAG: diaminopimelate decarboxylase [Candidatus Omnitrophica bacterium]|nr:diaminopimelate decarboxylase [Candidatus Omnitrophota bacterium]
MSYFDYKKGQLYCEGIPIKSLAAKFGTPLYVYSTHALTGQFKILTRLFAGQRPLICYSVKANSNLAILKLLIGQGAGLDIVSGGELYRAQKAGCPAKRIVYASVGKTKKEIEEAVRYGILMFNAESLSELRVLDAVAGRLKKKVKVALRFNPDIEPGTHAYITTGKKETKFGLDEYTLQAVYLHPAAYPHLSIEGIHMHIGSQITKAAGFVKAVKKVKTLIARLDRRGISVKTLNIGGGLGIPYDEEENSVVDEVKKQVIPFLKGMKVRLIIEPGRFIAGNSGVMVTRVIYVKDTPHKRFVIVDGAMNDLARPSLYGAYHRIIPVSRNARRTTLDARRVDVVGPVCETGDFLGKNRDLNVTEGEYLCVMSAGAYGFTMSSQYNSRCRAAEVLVNGTNARLIRKRETYKDLITKELV